MRSKASLLLAVALSLLFVILLITSPRMSPDSGGFELIFLAAIKRKISFNGVKFTINKSDD
jgi:hypothetical protein